MGDSRRHPRAEKRPRRRVAGAARQEAGRTLRRAGNHAAGASGFPAHGAAFVRIGVRTYSNYSATMKLPIARVSI